MLLHIGLTAAARWRLHGNVLTPKSLPKNAVSYENILHKPVVTTMGKLPKDRLAQGLERVMSSDRIIEKNASVRPMKSKKFGQRQPISNVVKVDRAMFATILCRVFQSGLCRLQS